MLRYRYLFSQLVRRELRRKYKGSAFGVLWYLVNPIVLMAAYWFMFGVVYKKQPIQDYPIFLMVGIVVWTFFQQSMLSSAPSLIDQSGLVRKARFPREAIPAATVTVQLVIFAAVLIMFLPVAVAIRGTFTPALLLLPVLMALFYVFVLGCSLIASVLHAYFRDVEPILTAALLPWFFITPIFFQLSTLGPVKSHPWIGTVLDWVNPIAPFVESFRSVMYGGTAPELGQLLYALAAATTALAIGASVFRRMQGELAVVL
jgi:ABC-type polysaccharide/polyol phosphate export permease